MEKPGWKRSDASGPTQTLADPTVEQITGETYGGLKALADKGYTGHFSLELETRDVTNDQRPAAAARAAAAITNFI